MALANGNPDVIVAGAGLAGLVAAVAAQEDGAHVVLYEKAEKPGGSTALSGGYLWTLPDLESYLRVVPRGDPILGRCLVEDFETGIEWLRKHDVRLGAQFSGLEFEPEAVGCRIEPDTITGIVQPLMNAFEAAGGTLVCRSRVVGAAAADHGNMVVRVDDASREKKQLECRGLVLATGGFQGDGELMARYFGPWADRLWLRASPHSVGDGMRLGTAAGAAVSQGLGSFYGHLLPAPPAVVEPSQFRLLTPFFSTHCVLLNLHGERFVDESCGDHVSALALSRELEALGFLVFDEACREAHVVGTYVPDMSSYDPLPAVRAAHGTIFEAQTLSELANMLKGQGVPSQVAARTLIDYDRSADLGRRGELMVERRFKHHPLRESPFFAIPVRPGITFTEGGLAVNENCQVLDRDRRPMNGLFAAGTDVGNVSNEGYAGGLAAALITGLRAGISAARAGAW